MASASWQESCRGNAALATGVFDYVRRRTYLRTVSLAVPGLLLSGWAPLRPAMRTVQLVIRDVAGEEADALRKGVDFGIDEVRRTAKMMGVDVAIERVAGDAASVVARSGGAIQVVVSDRDEGSSNSPDPGPRVYTCGLREWRPEAWSVASRPARARRQGAMSRDWHPALARDGAGQLNQRFFRYAGQPMDEAAWRGWMAVKVAFESAVRAGSGEDDLLALQFDGHKGQPLRFSENGHLVQPTYRVGPHARPVAVSPAVAAEELM